MKSTAIKPLPKPPVGYRLFRADEVGKSSELFAYQHMLQRAFSEMKLSAILTLNGIPTVYVRDSEKPLVPKEAAGLQRDFWNQGVASVLLVRDPHHVRVFSSMTPPLDPEKATEEQVNDRLVETIDMATQAAWAVNFYQSLANGSYYATPQAAPRFDRRESVDSYLINNLEIARNVITTGNDALPTEVAHSFLGRILFVSYLCHRGILKLGNYLPGGPWEDLRDFLAKTPAAKANRLLYQHLFPALRDRFNGSMFDVDLEKEKKLVKPGHWLEIQHFLDGSKMASGQKTLGFWAYRFDFIPVETISSIYEKFFQIEDSGTKRNEGAFYTPRLLAEMTLDLALRERKTLEGLRAIDPSCGSGIFLVIIFNRLVAEWNSTRQRRPSSKERAKALLRILGQLRGVDRNATACRVACFSLYLAYLDQFSPADVEEYIETTGKMLPSILDSPSVKKPDLPVVIHSDFFDVADKLQGQFDLAVGNPPWAGRGSKQTANDFMEKAPSLLREGGNAALILPSKIFLNPSGEAFQRKWLAQITLDTLVQLADYSFILFKEALCPACIAVFSKGAPSKSHRIEYITPKVSLFDLRDGLIPISPNDRKWIRITDLLDNDMGQSPGVVWKSSMWGTPRDRKLLDYLFTLPRLDSVTHKLSDGKNTQCKPWITGQGCKPWHPEKNKKSDRALREFGEWKKDDLFISPSAVGASPILDKTSCVPLESHFKSKGYSLKQLYSKPPEQLFSPPLVVVNHGFTKAVLSEFPVRFQHTLQSFTSIRGTDSNELLFLALYLTSKLARYFVFHTSANLGIERDKVHLEEVLQLPFMLPDDESAPKDARTIVSKIADLAKVHQMELAQLESENIPDHSDSDDWFPSEIGKSKYAPSAGLTARISKLSKEFRTHIDALIYRYFGLTVQDIVLVEDTCNISDKGDTPSSLESAIHIPNLRTVGSDEDLSDYAEMISATLNGWSANSVKIVAKTAVHPPSGMALVELGQSQAEDPVRSLSDSARVIEAAHRLQSASTSKLGRSLEFRRHGWYFDGKRILIVKPARLGEWTRTAALNDAAELYSHIVKSRESAKA
jgi:hypothetical protein